MRSALSSLLLAGALTAVAGDAAAQLDGAVPPATLTGGTLSFDGHATVGDFTGTTDEVTGEMSGGDGLAAVRGWVEAPARSLETGNGKRDRDLNKSLESDRYPVIRFDLDRVMPEEVSAERATLSLQGRMSIHGVTREITLPARVRLVDGTFRVSGEFPLNLKDYEIGGLSKLLGMLRMYEDIEVRLDLTFTPRQASGTGDPHPTEPGDDDGALRPATAQPQRGIG